MTQALQHLIQANPPQEDTAALWKEAIRTALDESPTAGQGWNRPKHGCAGCGTHWQGN
jgi:hypothetical protein